MAQVLHTDRGDQLVSRMNAHSFDRGDLLVLSTFQGTDKHLVVEVLDNRAARVADKNGQQLRVREGASEWTFWTDTNAPLWRVTGGRA